MEFLTGRTVQIYSSPQPEQGCATSTRTTELHLYSTGGALSLPPPEPDILHPPAVSQLAGCACSWL